MYLHAINHPIHTQKGIVMDFDLETLKRIAKRVGDKAEFPLESKEMPFFLMGEGRKWLKQVKTTPPLFAFSDMGKKQLSKG
jgi:hypothetical protein